MRDKVRMNVRQCRPIREQAVHVLSERSSRSACSEGVFQLLSVPGIMVLGDPGGSIRRARDPRNP